MALQRVSELRQTIRKRIGLGSMLYGQTTFWVSRAIFDRTQLAVTSYDMYYKWLNGDVTVDDGNFVSARINYLVKWITGRTGTFNIQMDYNGNMVLDPVNNKLLIGNPYGADVRELSGYIDVTSLTIQGNNLFNVGIDAPMLGYGTIEVTATLELEYEYAQTTYMLTIAVSPTEGGTTNPAPGSIEYTPGELVTVSAIPNTGYDFSYWLLDGYQYTGSPLAVSMDKSKDLTAIFVVEGEPPPPPPPPPPNGNGNGNGNGVVNGEYTDEIHLFDAEKLKTLFWETAKTKTKTFKAAPSIVANAFLEYTVAYVQGNDPGVNTRIRLNDEIMAEEWLSWGQSVSGQIDIKGKVLNLNTLQLWMGSDPLLWSEVSFDVWVTIEYTEDPGPQCPFPMFLPRFLLPKNAPVLCGAYSLMTGSKR